MKTLRSLFLLIFLLAFAVPCFAAPAAASRKPAITTLMYLVNRPDSIAGFRAHADQISIIAPQTFRMDAEGFVSGEVPPEVLAIARTKRVAIMPLVTNRGFDQPLMHTVLDNPATRARAIRYLLYYALRDGYIGFQFDYENIHYTYRDKFSAFFREAAGEFHRYGLLLSIAVVGKYSDDRNSESPGGFDNWSGVYDYRALGRYADFLSIMAYPQHAGFSDPGPIAGYPWVQQIVDFTLSQVPARKVSLGVPLYGVHWTSLAAGQAAKVDFVQDAANPNQKKWQAQSAWYPALLDLMQKYPPVWDETERAPHLAWSDNGTPHDLWYEDARSLQPKLDLAVSKRLIGISAWVLGQEDPAFWTMLEQNYRVTHPRPRAATGDFSRSAKLAARKLAGKKQR